MLKRRHQHGDTIIEVILAFAVFALLAVGAMAIMNQGAASAQQSLESTLVRQQIDGQAATLRYMQESYVDDATASGPAATFKQIIDSTKNPSASSFASASCATTLPSNSFAIDTEQVELITAKAVSEAGAPPYARVVDISGVKTAFGLWVEAVDKAAPVAGEPRYIDFHIRACWFGPVSPIPSTIGTIVRLYVPA